MTLVLINAPEDLPVTLDEAKTHLRVDGTDENDLITALIQSAVSHMDCGWIGRALMTQTWELRIDRFSDEITIPYPPLQSVDSVKYIDENGVEQTLSTDVYRVLLGEPAKISLKYGKSWPSTRDELQAVRITFTAGYETLPAPLKSALLLHIGTLYRDREATGQQQVELPMAYEALLLPFKVY